MYTDADRHADIVAPFVQNGYVTGLTRVVRKGKEATVLCCEAHPDLGVDYLALKLYKDAAFRNFKKDAEYLAGKVWDKRLLKRLKMVKDDLWVQTEFQMLTTLHKAGVRVPRPYAWIDRAILMEFIGRADQDAPPLKDVRFDDKEAVRVFDQLLEMLDVMVFNNVVHGDLSPFNILYDGQEPIIIDFPQAIYVSTHTDPYTLFRRDVRNLVDYFCRFGVDPEEDVAADIWSRYHRL